LRQLGLHLRIETTLVALIERALELELDFFQCFLTLKTAGRVLTVSQTDMDLFLALRRKYFTDIYLHVSYWVNLSSVKYNPHLLFKKEIELARRLEFTHVILHPGSAKGAKDRTKGIDALARILNHLVEHVPDLTFTLENVAQGPPCIGGNINDFRLLLEKLDQPERVDFCIDTGHAYSHGYDLSNINYQETFLDLVDEKISLERVALIHLNDTGEKLGAKIDRHKPLGKGKIGLDALKRFVLHPRIKDKPVLLEPPMMPEDQVEQELEMVRGWIKE